MYRRQLQEGNVLGKPKNGYNCIPLITQGQPSRPRSLPTETFMINRSEHLSHHLPILFRHRVPEGPMMGHTGLVPAFSAFPILMSSLDFLPASLPSLPSPGPFLCSRSFAPCSCSGLFCVSPAGCGYLDSLTLVWSRNTDHQTPAPSPRHSLLRTPLFPYPRNKRFVWTVE